MTVCIGHRTVCIGYRTVCIGYRSVPISGTLVCIAYTIADPGGGLGGLNPLRGFFWLVSI